MKEGAYMLVYMCADYNLSSEPAYIAGSQGCRSRVAGATVDNATPVLRVALSLITDDA